MEPELLLADKRLKTADPPEASCLWDLETVDAAYSSAVLKPYIARPSPLQVEPRRVDLMPSQEEPSQHLVGLG
jgi:hypothetical protein